MPIFRWRASRVATFLALFLAAAAVPVFGASLQVLVDVDNNPATGCTASLPSGSMSGVEQRFATTVDTTVNPPQVTGVTREDCNTSTGVFGAPVVVSTGGWNVGVGNGTGGSNVIETSLPLPPAPAVVRLGFAYVDGAIGTDALFTTSGGGPILFGLGPGAEPIPALSPAMLALLAALVGGVGYGVLRRRGIPIAPLAVVALSLVATLAWAAIVMDGLIGDWAGIAPIATDAQGDSPVGADLVAVFVQPAPPILYVRADVRTAFPPTAAADGYSANVATTLNVAAAGGLLANDTLGVPAGAIASYGGGSLGGAVTDHAAGATTSFGAGGSLTVNADGSLAFTPAAGFTGHFTFDYRLSNINGSSDATVDIAAQQAPAFTSAPAATFVVTGAGSFTLTASGQPAPTFALSAGTLPTGLSLNATSGVISGTPAGGTAGTYTLTFTASNGVAPNAAQSFTLTVNQSPSITSASGAAFSLNQAGTFTVTTTGIPSNASMSITETGALPPGVTFVNNNNGTATLAGTPTAQGAFPITITAANGVTPNATQSFTLTVNAAPTITSANTATFKVGTAGTFAVTTTGTPSGASMTITETGALPPGVSFGNNNDGTATLAGTAGAGSGGTYPITITAANGVAPNAVQSFTLTVQQAPSITSANAATFVLNQAGTFTVTAAGSPTNASMSITQTGALPAGVTLVNNGNGTATLAGTPTTQGVFPITVTANNGVTPNATQSFTLTVNAAPAISSANNATFKVGTAGTFTVTTTGTPSGASMAISETGALPAGISLVNNNDGTATLSGTPAAATGGSYSITIGAANGVAPAASQGFTLTVQQAPAITSANNATFVANQAGTFGVTATGFPTNASMTLSETGSLPAGLTFVNNGNGSATIAGTPTVSGSFPISITAANGVTPNATQSFTLAVNQAPAITSSNNATFTVGAAGTFTVTTTGTPSGASMVLSKTGALPPGVTFVNNNDGTATLSGTPTAAGSFPITITAANGVAPNATQSYTLTVEQAPSITSANNATLALNQAGTFTVTTTGLPTNASMSITETGALPAGVTFVNNNNGTATLAGTPTAQGVFPITIAAANGVTPNAAQAFTLTVNAAPAITSANNATFRVGTAGSFTVTTTGTPSGASMALSETGALPSGVTFVSNNDGTATLAGTPTAPGTFPITINAANGIAPNASQSFTLTVNQSPAITSAASASFIAGQAGTFTVTTTGSPTNASMTISETGSLPAGVSFVNNGNGTATIAGTASVPGSFPITITAANGVTPNATQSFTLSVDQAPSITSANNITFAAGVPNTFSVTTTGTPTVTSIAQTGSALPSGVSFSYAGGANGTLAGTPVATGSTSFSFTASNGVAPDATQPFTLNVVCPAISVSPTTLANATLNASYGPVAFSASGGSGSYAFSLGVGSPTGLSFTGASLGGTPTVAGTYTFAVTATDTLTGCAGATTFSNFMVGITASNDTFGTVIGNTLVDSASATVPFSVTANDVVSPSTTISAFDSASAQGGTVTMVTSGANLGQFTYDPPRGYTGTDTFTYTIADGAATDTATVTITVSGRVWYVNNAAGACSSSCDGRESHPYTSLAAFNAANTNTSLNPQIGDTIFVYTGSGAYTGPLTLLASQRLMGQGSSTAFSGLPAPNGQALPGVPGTFPNLNALVAFTSGNALAGFDMDGSAARLSASSATSFTVNVGRLRSTTAGASAFTLGGSGNSGTIDLKSLSAAGAPGSANFGVQVQNLTGHFNVSGTDTLSPAGGTVSGFGASGLSFTGIAQCASLGNCSGNAVSLANMTISGNAISQVVAGSSTGCGGDLVAGDNLSCFANVYLRNIDGVSITGSTISNSKQIGINGNNVYDFTIASTGVTNNGDEAFESGLLFQNLHGTSAFTSLTATNNAAYQVYVEQQNSGSPSQPLNLSIASSTFSNATNAATTGLDGVRLSGAGGTTTFNVSGSTFQNFGSGLIIPASALLILPGTSTSAMNLTGSVQTSTFANALAGVDVEVAGTSNVTFDTKNNSSFTQMVGRSIFYQTLDGSSGLVQGTISGNTIGNAVLGSACSSTLCHGIEVDHAPAGTGSLELHINNNTIQQVVNGLGIRLLGGGGGTLQAKVLNNALDNPAGSAAGGQNEAIGLDAAVTSGSSMTVCLDMSGNTVSEGSTTTWGSGNSGSDIYLDQRFTTVVTLPGYTGAATDTTAVASFAAGQNPPETVFADTSGSGGYVNGSCITP